MILTETADAWFAEVGQTLQEAVEMLEDCPGNSIRLRRGHVKKLRRTIAECGFAN